MKKIININFHSRVVPIEETAYDILRKYIESLKKHFAGEEGGDEIVNDIENRFAELFSDRLKKGAECITDENVEEIITSMGRPEDFDQDENPNSNGPAGGRSSSTYTEETASDEPRRLYRSENDKMVAGVCGGIAAYLRIDPSLVRIVYAIIILGSFGTALLVYFILWIALPPKSLVTKIRKRLYRDTDHRVIGGVASGLAAYFNIEVWIPRVIFCLPLIAGVLTSIFRHTWFDYDGPLFFTGGFGGALFTTYIILWIVLPEALTASEKLEMRGEKIDLESIKNTIKGDLEGFRQKATDFGNEMKNKSAGIKKEISAVNIPRRGIGHAIGVLFKAFFLFIAVIVTFALTMALIGLLFTGAGVMPLKAYFIQGFWQNIMAWAVVLLFIVLPVVALLTAVIRRIIGVRSRSNYLGYIFGSLWIIGLISLIVLAATFSRRFTAGNGIQEDIPMMAPVNGKLIVKMDDSKPVFFESDWMGMNWHHKGPFFEINEDSVTMNNVRIAVEKSDDSAWHLSLDKLSRGNNSEEAKQKAGEINFQIDQKDSLLVLGRGFGITPKQQFRNQQVLVVIKVPVGKKIFMSENLDAYHWFTINRKWQNNDMSMNWEYTDDHDNSWDFDVEYVMTEHGLERTGKHADTDKGDNEEDKIISPDSTHQKNDKNDYRYHKPKSVQAAITKDPKSSNNEENGNGAYFPTLARLTSMS